MKIASTKRTIRKIVKIGYTDILEFLISKKQLDLSKHEVVSMTFPVPGGGDYSNTNLDVEDDSISIVIQSEENG